MPPKISTVIEKSTQLGALSIYITENAFEICTKNIKWWNIDFRLKVPKYVNKYSMLL